MKHYPSYQARLEADRQAQHSGYGIQPYHCADGSIKWEAYGWERLSELSIHTTSYGIFDHKWEAEQYFNAVINTWILITNSFFNGGKAKDQECFAAMESHQRITFVA